MIVVDSSAVVAIIKDEPEYERFVALIEADGGAVISAANYLEASMACEGVEGAAGRALFEREFGLIERLGLSVAPIDRNLAELAREGFRRYGKGRHPAGLNFGDCFAYALAKALDAPLLFKGDDFAKTDVKRV